MICILGNFQRGIKLSLVDCNLFVHVASLTVLNLPGAFSSWLSCRISTGQTFLKDIKFAAVDKVDTLLNYAPFMIGQELTK